MSLLSNPTDVLFFQSVLYRSDLFTLDKIKTIIEEDFCDSKNEFKIHFIFEHDFFPMKEYYSKEMGDQNLLKRVFFVNSKLEDRKRLVDLKIKAEQFEKKYSDQSSRRINLDVGFIALDQVVLATGKPYYHRIHLDHGVYANLELFFQNNEWTLFPWSYPDYSHKEIREFFLWIRSFLKNL